MWDFRKEDEFIQPKSHKFTIIFLPGWTRSAIVDANIFRNVPLLENTRIRIVQSPYLSSFPGAKAFPSWFQGDIEVYQVRTPSMLEMSKLINEIIEEEYSICKNLFLGGFSQGGLMALYSGLVHNKLPLLGVFGLSCVPIPFEYTRFDVPLFIYHGCKDEIIDININKALVEGGALDKFRVKYLNEHKLGHTYTWKEFVELKKWMKECISSEKI